MADRRSPAWTPASPAGTPQASTSTPAVAKMASIRRSGATAGKVRSPPQGATAQQSCRAEASRAKAGPPGPSFTSPAAIPYGVSSAATRSRRSSAWASRCARSSDRCAETTPTRTPPIRTTAVARPRRCSPGVCGRSTSSVRSTKTRKLHSSSGPVAVAPPPRTTRSHFLASRAACLRHRKNRGASCTKTRSGSQARMTRTSASSSSRSERML